MQISHNEIVFNRGNSKRQLYLTNNSQSIVIFKIRTNDINHLSAYPARGYIQQKQTQTIEISCTKSEQKFQAKLQIVSAVISQKQQSFQSTWSSVEKGQFSTTIVLLSRKQEQEKQLQQKKELRPIYEQQSMGSSYSKRLSQYSGNIHNNNKDSKQDILNEDQDSLSLGLSSQQGSNKSNKINMHESSSLVWESNCNSKGLMRESNQWNDNNSNQSNSRYNSNSSIMNINSGNAFNMNSSHTNPIPNNNNNNISKHNNTTNNNIRPYQQTTILKSITSPLKSLFSGHNNSKKSNQNGGNNMSNYNNSGINNKKSIILEEERPLIMQQRQSIIDHNSITSHRPNINNSMNSMNNNSRLSMQSRQVPLQSSQLANLCHLQALLLAQKQLTQRLVNIYQQQKQKQQIRQQNQTQQNRNNLQIQSNINRSMIYDNIGQTIDNGWLCVLLLVAVLCFTIGVLIVGEGDGNGNGE